MFGEEKSNEEIIVSIKVCSERETLIVKINIVKEASPSL